MKQACWIACCLASLRNMNYKGIKISIILCLLLLALFMANIFCGAVSIPASQVLDILCGQEVAQASWSFIVWESRVPQALTALCCGASLAVSGLLLQTAFSNPLAGPSILGINSGASLGVALVMLAGGGTLTAGAFSLTGFLAIVMGALLGAMLVMGIILLLSTVIKGNIMLLIAGIMLGYITSSLISLLNFFATQQGVHSYMIWGLGNFGGVSREQLPWLVAFTLIGLILAILLIKPLNAMLLGPRYAENLGVNLKRTRNLLLLATGILTAVTTAFCGPVAFIGLAVPHMARLVLGTSNHNSLLPVTLILGAVVALLCNLICILPSSGGIIPLNAVTPVLGAPVIIYVIINQHRIQYFN